MPNFLENRLRAQAAAKGFTGERADRYVYGAMNNRGYMRGNVETSKGRAVEAKHQRDVKAGRASNGHPHKNLGQYLHPRKRRR